MRVRSVLPSSSRRNGVLGLILGALVCGPVLGARSAEAGTGSIVASPATVVVASGSTGTTTLSFSTSDGSTAQVYVSEDGGTDALFAMGSSLTQGATWIQPGHSYAFKLYAGAAHTQLLASTTVLGVPEHGGMISASPATVVVPPRSTGTTTVVWAVDPAKLGKAQVWRSANGGAEVLFADSPSDSKTASLIRAGDSYEFKLYAEGRHVQLLATATVRGVVAATTISSIAPASAGVGSTVTVTGTSLAGATQVTVSGVAASTYSWNGSGTQLTFVVPPGASSGPISVTAAGTATSASPFTVAAAPTISGTNPTSGVAGTSVEIDGTNLSGATAVSFGGTPASFTSVSATCVTAIVPAASAPGPVTVTTPGGTASSAAFFVAPPGPTIAQITRSGPVGSAVAVTGAYLGDPTRITFGGTVATQFEVAGITSLVVIVPPGARTGPISVTTSVTAPSGTVISQTATSSDTFFVTAASAPTITRFTPGATDKGSLVTITGTGFYGATAVTFNGKSATFTYETDTQIAAQVPSGAGVGPIAVTTPSGTALSTAPFHEKATSVVTDLKAWHANGQTWLLWTDNQTFTGDETYDIYVSASPITALGNATLAGRTFPDDWRASRLKLAGSSLTWTIPDGAGGSHTLAANEAMFAYTPHAAVPAYFAVVKHGATDLVTGENSLAAAVTQTTDPVQPYVQDTGTYSGSPFDGQTFTDFAFWIDGEAPGTQGRPDFAIMGNATANGTAAIFRVYAPPGGMPTSLVPAIILLHGGGRGSWVGAGPQIAPAGAPNGVFLTQGLVIAPDDDLFYYNAQLSASGVGDAHTRWVGYWNGFDRFSSGLRSLPPQGATLSSYTVARTRWMVQWLLANEPIDPNHLAIMGHSAGGEGTHIYSRLDPQLYCAAVALSAPTSVLTTDHAELVLTGDQALDLATDLPGAPGFAQVLDPRFPLSSLDLPLLTYVWGVNDPEVVWTYQPSQPVVIDGLDELTFGQRIYWDERVHAPADWSSADHWFGSPRQSAQYVVGFAANQSFPAYSLEALTVAADGDPFLAIPGSTTAQNWGTKAGYEDWDPTTITDAPTWWHADLYLVGSSDSSLANDVPTFATATANVSIRRAQQYRPAAGTTVHWTFLEVKGGSILQEGTTTVGADGVVTVPGLTIPQDPNRGWLQVQ